MKSRKEPFLPVNRLSKGDQTTLVALEIIRDEKAAREEKTKRLKAARIKRDADEQNEQAKNTLRTFLPDHLNDI